MRRRRTIAIDPEEQRISLRVDPGRQLREVDPEARESFISLGALTESLRRSLTARGYALDLSIAATPDTNETLVTVRYRESAATPDDAELALFAARHTDKRSFANRALSHDAVDSILAAAPQAATYWPAGSDRHAVCVVDHASPNASAKSMHAGSLFHGGGRP